MLGRGAADETSQNNDVTRKVCCRFIVVTEMSTIFLLHVNLKLSKIALLYDLGMFK